MGPYGNPIYIYKMHPRTCNRNLYPIFSKFALKFIKILVLESLELKKENTSLKFNGFDSLTSCRIRDDSSF